MASTTYIPVAGIITNIVGLNDCCSQMMTLRTEDGTVNFVVGADTKVIDNRQLRVGMRVAAFYDSSLPVPLIFPPQYQAWLVTTVGRDENVMLDYFDRSLLAADQSLQLEIGVNTVMRTENGQIFTCSPGEQLLLVYYSATTRSIPPQTAPRRIVVLCGES